MTKPRIGLLMIAVLAGVGCREAVPPTGPTTTVVTTVVTTGGPGSGPTNPQPGQPTNPTPSPASGYLPLPTYGQTVLTGLAASPQGQLSLQQSCYLTQGAVASWGFIDALVDQLRALDQRWGYVCYRGSCAQPAQDAVAYHATSGPSVTGAVGIWAVTVIANYCTGTASATWQPTYDAAGSWTTRGRF